MIPWIVLVVLIIAEAAGFAWWIRREYYRVLFNQWAILIYSSILAADCVVAWLVSMLFTPDGSPGNATLAGCAVLLLVLVALFTLFFRWVIRQDLGGPQT